VAWLPFAGMVLGRALRKDSFYLPWAAAIAGWILTLALVASWGIPALEQSHGQFWAVGMGEHVFHRSIAVNDSHGVSGFIGFLLLLPLYFLTFLISFLPWTLRKPVDVEPWLQKQNGFAPVLRILMFPLHVPLKIWRWWPERRRDDVGWYLLVQALVVFVVFSLVKTKLPHYTMPAFPCVALWLALQLRSDAQAIAWFQWRFAVMVVLILAVMLGLANLANRHALTQNVWRTVKAQVQPQTKVGCFGYVEPSLVWKFRSVITNTVTLGNEQDAKDFLTNAPPYILVLPTSDVASLPDTNGVRFPVHGLDMVKFKNRDLTVIVR
jgi:4-amino-4-deoxy-L-arabinose transferase-like glycosyltransferase